MASYIVPPLYIPPPPGIHMSGPVAMPMMPYPTYAAPPTTVYNVNVGAPPSPYPYAPYPSSYYAYPQGAYSNPIPSYPATHPLQPGHTQPTQPKPPILPEAMAMNPAWPAPHQPTPTMETALKQHATQQVQNGLQAFFRGVTVSAIPVALLGAYALISSRYTSMSHFFQVAQKVGGYCLSAIGVGGLVSTGWAYKDVAKALLNQWFIKPATGSSLPINSNGFTSPVNFSA